MSCRWQIPNSDSVTHDTGNSTFDLILADKGKPATELKISWNLGTSYKFYNFD